MSCRLLSVGLLCAALWARGCCIGDGPYDYCYPTFTGDECGEPHCRTCERVGSIHYNGMVPDSSSVYREVETPTEAAPATPPETPRPAPYYDGAAPKPASHDQSV
jgi:hypothetical protein